MGIVLYFAIKIVLKKSKMNIFTIVAINSIFQF